MTSTELNQSWDEIPWDGAETWDEESGTRPIIAPGVVLSGRYRIERRLADGGMATLWSAIDLTQPSPARVAVKVMNEALAADPRMRVRFEREAAIAAALTGPSFVRLHATGAFHRTAFIVMELLTGEDLHAHLRSVGRLSLLETQHIVRAVAKGLTEAHAVGVVHRDLKPHNIFLVSGEGRADRVKLLDFGVAQLHACNTRITGHGIVVGSAHYMSPEQACAGRPVDHRSDLFSLAATIYRCLTGWKPFQGDAVGVFNHILNADPVRPSRILPTVPSSIDRFFEVGLAKIPNRRFQSAAQLAAAFDAIVDEARAGDQDVARIPTRRHRPPRSSSATAITAEEGRGAVTGPTKRAGADYAELVRQEATAPKPTGWLKSALARIGLGKKPQA